MKPSLKPGLKHQLMFRVSERQTVPNFCPESRLFRTMPAVFAIGEGRHESAVVNYEKFNARVADKAKAAGAAR